ncbi:MAG TPA: efflux RND transporter periplasmic adaptor subunit [Candidatus Saccharimonadales bacterium]|nr:efflux RND transporter periplasmic adaptor subunit [Candidatus Saccharimonadales bacterium]
MKKAVAKFKDRQFLKRFGIVVLILLVIGAIIVYENFQGRIFIDDSLVQAPIITISPSSSGQVQELDVTEGQRVQKGDTLAIIGSQTIHADTDGLIVTAPNITGSSVTPATQLIQMINPVDMRIAGTLDENKGLSDIKVGQVASFTVDAFPGKKYWGYVDEIAPTAKTSQLSFSISSERPTQQFVVYVKFDSAKYPEIKNGMSAKMTVYTKTP